MDKTHLFDFLSRQKLGVLGSVTANGKPQSSLVGIAVTPDFELVFDTVSDSRKYANLMANPSCSFAIGWEGEQTVQYEGIAKKLDGPALKPYQEIYFRAWPDGPSRLDWPGLVYFLIRPRWIRYSDFDQAPPAIHEFSFD